MTQVSQPCALESASLRSLSFQLGVIGLWKNRHIRDLKYDTSQLSWDVLVEDGYEDDRILVGNLPNGITQYSVVLHLQSTGCIAPDIDLKTVFCSDHQEAVVFFSDSIAGKTSKRLETVRI